MQQKISDVNNIEYHNTNTIVKKREPLYYKIEDENQMEEKDSKVNRIADQIINSITVKRREPLIDKSGPEDDITTEESEKRLLLLSFLFSTLSSIIALVLLLLYCQAIQSKAVILFNENYIEPEHESFPIPFVTFMQKNGNGYLATFKLTQHFRFEMVWDFKVPSQPLNLGFFAFEDQGNHFIVSAKMDRKMTIIQSPSKHNIIAKSQLNSPFYLGFSVRMGQFVLVYGGRKWNNPNSYWIQYDLGCSSVPINKTNLWNLWNPEPGSSTEIWSIKKQKWIKGPYVPIN